MSAIIEPNNPAFEDIVPDHARFQLYTPTKTEERPYRDAMSYLTFKWQFLSTMLYSGMEIAYTHSLMTAAATDSHTIFLNPEWFEKLEINTIPEKVFVFAHEVGHRIMNDLPLNVVWRKAMQVYIGNGEYLPYNSELMNIAEDYRINAMLKEAGVGKMPKCALYDPSLSQAGYESSVEIYAKLFKHGGGKPPTGSAGGLPGQQPGGAPGQKGQVSFDLHLEPTQAQIAKDKGKREQEIVAAAQLAERTKGTIPGAMKRIIDDIVQPKVPWEQYLRTSMLRKAGPPKLDWRFRNRRLAGRDPDPLFYAKTAHIGAGTVVCIGDNSGSIGDKETNAFAGEMAGIVAELNPMQFVAIWCDTEVTRYEELEEPSDLLELFAKWKKEGVGGGGGSDMRPAFKKIDEMGLVPDMVVCFTDGHITFPEQEPLYPTIWCSTSTKASGYPWGEVVEIEI